MDDGCLHPIGGERLTEAMQVSECLGELLTSAEALTHLGTQATGDIILGVLFEMLVECLERVIEFTCAEEGFGTLHGGISGHQVLSVAPCLGKLMRN